MEAGVRRILLVIFLLMPVRTWAANISTGTWYVDHGAGTDNSTCGATSGAGACAHLNYILNTRTWDSMAGPVTIECGGTGADTTAVTIPAKTGTSAANYILIHGNNTSGLYNTSAYRLEISSGDHAIDLQNDFTTLDHLQINNTLTNKAYYSAIRVRNTLSSGAITTVSRCIIYLVLSGTSTPSYGYYQDSNALGTTRYIYLYNNIFYNCIMSSSTEHCIYINMGSPYCAAYLYNNTFANSNTGYEGIDNASVVAFKNNLFTGVTVATVSLTGAAKTDYNATDGSALGYTAQSHDRVSQTFTFQGAAPDYRLASTDAGAREYGLTDPGSGLFSDDIVGTVRPVVTSWDIGAFEAPAPASSAAPRGLLLGVLPDVLYSFLMIQVIKWR